jgi:hypothetical protein
MEENPTNSEDEERSTHFSHWKRIKEERRFLTKTEKARETDDSSK